MLSLALACPRLRAAERVVMVAGLRAITLMGISAMPDLCNQGWQGGLTLAQAEPEDARVEFEEPRRQGDEKDA